MTGGALGVAAGTAGKDVAHPVDLDGAARRLAPADEELPSLAVEIGQRQAADAAFLASPRSSPSP